MPASTREQLVRTYAAAFGTCDINTIVDCVSDDLVWEFNGTRAGEGKAAFTEQMKADLSTGRADVHIEEVVEQGDVMVALNKGSFVPNEGDPMPFVSAEVYTFTGDKISRIRTYQPLG